MTIDLSGSWSFRADPSNAGETAGWYADALDTAAWREVNVPVGFDGCGPDMERYIGAGWFRRRVFVPEPFRERRIVLRFEGMSYNARVWVNGKAAGESHDAFLPFELDIGDAARIGSENTIAVRIDNVRSRGQFPLFEGWYGQGGFLREASLAATGRTHIVSTYIMAEPDGGGGRLSLTACAVNGAGSRRMIRIRVHVTDGEGAEIAVFDSPRLDVPQDASVELHAGGPVTGVRPWSPDNPVLYTAQVTLLEDGRPADTLTRRIGFRRVEVRDARLLLNGEPVFLRGFNRHEDSPRTGMAADIAQVREDLIAMKELGCNFVRLCHYPHHPGELDLCDELGIMVLAENAMNEWGHVDHPDPNGGFALTPEDAPIVMENARRTLGKMVERDNHHPSIVIWSVSNENAEERPDVAAGNGELIRFGRSLDVSRPWTHVSNCWGKTGWESFYLHDDVITVNVYPSHHIDLSRENLDAGLPEATKYMEDALAVLHGEFPEKPIVIGEFGYPGGESGPEGAELQRIATAAELEGLGAPYVAGCALWAYARHPWPDNLLGGGKRNVISPYGYVSRDRKTKFPALDTAERWYGTKRGAYAMQLKHDGLIRMDIDEQSAAITALGWDTEGTGRERIDFLKEPITLTPVRSGRAVPWTVRMLDRSDQQVCFLLQAEDGFLVEWTIGVSADGLLMELAARTGAAGPDDRLDLVLPIDPTVAVASIITDHWFPDGRFGLPAILSLPDLGQMSLVCPGCPEGMGRIEGSRPGRRMTITLGLPVPETGKPVRLTFTPAVLPLPDGCTDEWRWRAGRRGWFNMLQFSAGASGGGSAVKGVWANNTLSDPVSSLLYMLGDATLLLPELAPGVGMPPLLRRAVDYWLDEKTNAQGLVAYTARGTAGTGDETTPDDDPAGNQNVMDANPAVLIAAWCLVKATNDPDWLRERLPRLERLAAFMLRRDIDGDGLIESPQSGNAGSRPPRNPDCAWDCYCSGHKNAYVNILAYRAWRGLADLEELLGRRDQASLYRRQAERLKAIFLDTFYNPETGWLGFWQSRDGRLHDLFMDTPTSMAVAYGLISPEQGRPMLEKYWRALERTGFSRFDLGVPLNIRPVPREEMEEYFEFKQFLNGGCGVSNTAWLLDGLWRVGMKKESDIILDAMLKRQQEGVFPNGGGFQNGFVDSMGLGAEVFDWEGRPAGYEGHLVYCWSFLHALLLRDPAVRRRVYAGT